MLTCFAPVPISCELVSRNLPGFSSQEYFLWNRTIWCLHSTHSEFRFSAHLFHEFDQLSCDQSVQLFCAISSLSPVFREQLHPERLLLVPIVFHRRAAIHFRWRFECFLRWQRKDRKSTRLNSSHSQISYAVFFF